jgi:hypothetical protein
MDIVAVTELKSRAVEAVASAKRYRELAERTPALRAFYGALAVTYGRSAREMQLMLDKVERLSAITVAAA